MYQLLAKNGGIVTRRSNANARRRSLWANLGALGGDDGADPGVRVLAAGSAPLHPLTNKWNQNPARAIASWLRLHAAIFSDLRLTRSLIRQSKSCHLRLWSKCKRLQKYISESHWAWSQFGLQRLQFFTTTCLCIFFLYIFTFFPIGSIGGSGLLLGRVTPT